MGPAPAGNICFLLEQATRSLAVIATMLGGPPRQRRKPIADSSDRVIRTSTPVTSTPVAPRRPPAGPIADACGRLLELPVPMVLAALWILGAVLLGAAATAAYSVAMAIP